MRSTSSVIVGGAGNSSVIAVRSAFVSIFAGPSASVKEFFMNNPFSGFDHQAVSDHVENLILLLVDNKVLDPSQKRWASRVLKLARTVRINVRTVMSNRPDDIATIAAQMAAYLATPTLSTRENNWYMIAEKLMGHWDEEAAVDTAMIDEYLYRIRSE